MSSLRERVEGLVAEWRKNAESFEITCGDSEVEAAYYGCAAELAAALSLHKEGAGGEQRYMAFCSEHDLRLVDGRCDKCRDANGNTFVLDMQSYYLVPFAAAGTEKALPLQRTLPDEQFKGAVVEPITSGERDAARREALEEAALLVDKFTNPLKVAERLSWLESPMTFARVMEVISAEIRALASPAGRAGGEMSDTVEMWERIWFSKNEPVKWERSFDKGETWEAVNWPGEKLPFVLFNPADVDYVIEKKIVDRAARPAEKEPQP